MKREIEKFWLWFTENQERFEVHNTDHLIEIQDRLGFASDNKEYGIALEASELTENKRRLEVSADGVKELFDIVIQIVEAAPKLAGWEIIAFRQPAKTPFRLQFQDMEFDTSKMLFLPFLDDNHDLNLVIFGDNFKEYNETALFHYGLTTIDNVIGEYDCVMKVKGYDFVDKEEIGDNMVYPLEKLPHFLKNYYDVTSSNADIN